MDAVTYDELKYQAQLEADDAWQAEVERAAEEIAGSLRNGSASDDLYFELIEAVVNDPGYDAAFRLAACRSTIGLSGLIEKHIKELANRHAPAHARHSIEVRDEP